MYGVTGVYLRMYAPWSGGDHNNLREKIRRAMEAMKPTMPKTE
jgi:hypothetical protein